MRVRPPIAVPEGKNTGPGMSHKRRGRGLLRMPALPAIIFCGTVVVLIAIIQPSSRSQFGVELLLSAAIPAAFAALAQMFIIVAGDIDLGLGSALGLVNVLMATVMVSHVAEGLAAAVGIILAYAAMGWLIEVFQVPAIVVTLGASFVWLGAALVIQPEPGGVSPAWLSQVYNASLPVVPEPVYVLVAATGLAYWVLNRTSYGVVLRGFGNRPEALTQVGRSRVRARMCLYALAGLCVVLGGLAITAESYGSDANASVTYTLVSIAAVMIGGADFGGGVSSPTGSVLGALALALLSSLLSFLNVSTNYETGVLGVCLIAVFALRLVVRKLSARKGGDDR
jgi:ribose/xylose/arabinose/galactoside ABC-type transport system permease subunit